MQDLLTSGWIVDAILVLMAAEATLLLALWLIAGRGIRPIPLLANLAAGGSLLLALRSVLTGGSSSTLAVFLLLSLAAHVLDLICRWAVRPRAPL